MTLFSWKNIIQYEGNEIQCQDEETDTVGQHVLGPGFEEILSILLSTEYLNLQLGDTQFELKQNRDWSGKKYISLATSHFLSRY